MKRIAFTALIAAAVMAGFLFTRPTVAQTRDDAPGKIGLIDLAKVFQDYDKVKAMLKDFGTEAQQADANLKTKVQDVKRIQEQLKSGQFAEGSAEFKKLEAQLISLSTDIEAERKVLQRNFVRQEADIYKSVYVEIQETVGQLAKHYNYDVILRFSQPNIDEAGNPQQIMNSMNRQVVHFDPADDITATITRYLNKKYAEQGGN